MEMLKEYPNTDDLLSHPGITVHYTGVEALHNICKNPKGFKFKIGAAHDAHKRWVGYVDRNGKDVPPLCRDFKMLHVAVVGNNWDAIAGETELISTWKSSPACLNNTSGGDGINTQEETTPYFLYVALKK